MLPLRLLLCLSSMTLACTLLWAGRGSAALIAFGPMAISLVPRALTANVSPWLQSVHRQHWPSFAEAAGAGVAFAGAVALVHSGRSLSVVAAFVAIFPPTVGMVVAQAAARGLTARSVTQPVRALLVAREALPLGIAAIIYAAYSRVDAVPHRTLGA